MQEEFDGTIGGDGERKHFIRSLSKIFIILLNTKVDSVDKIKKILKIVVNIVTKLWSGQN